MEKKKKRERAPGRWESLFKRRRRAWCVYSSSFWFFFFFYTLYKVYPTYYIIILRVFYIPISYCTYRIIIIRIKKKKNEQKLRYNIFLFIIYHNKSSLVFGPSDNDGRDKKKYSRVAHSSHFARLRRIVLARISTLKGCTVVLTRLSWRAFLISHVSSCVLLRYHMVR